MKAKISIMMTVCFFLGLMLSGLAMAGEGEYFSAQKEMKGMDQIQVTPQNADKIIGLRVTNNQGDDLGWVEDMIFSRDGNLSYLVVTNGGFQSSDTLMGEGGNLTVIPYDSIRDGFHVSETAVNIPISLGKFSTAPSFSRNQLSNLQSGNWESKTNAYFE